MSQSKQPFSLDGVDAEDLGRIAASYFNQIDELWKKDDEWPSAIVVAIALSTAALRRLPGFESDTKILLDLAERFDRLSVGQKKPIMKIVDSATKSPGRPPDSTAEQILRAKAVALLQFLSGNGWSESDAAGLIADELSRGGLKGRQGGDVSARTVSEWAEVVKANDPVFKGIVQDMNELISPSVAQSNEQVRKFARTLLTNGFGHSG